jgi:hypothetical protein
MAGALLPVCDGGGLPERSAVHWRRTVDEAALRRSGRWWTASTAGHVLPFLLAAAVVVAGVLLGVLGPVTLVLAAVLLAHAWAIPELHAARGANVVRPRPRAGAAAERRALGLLADLLDRRAFALHARTGLVLEPAALGVWLLGEAGAILVPRQGRRVFCYCVKANGAELPAADRIAHLLLALRTDEAGFATVANLAFAGAPWRLRRRLAREMRPALAAARGRRADRR